MRAGRHTLQGCGAAVLRYYAMCYPTTTIQETAQYKRVLTGEVGLTNSNSNSNSQDTPRPGRRADNRQAQNKGRIEQSQVQSTEALSRRGWPRQPSPRHAHRPVGAVWVVRNRMATAGNQNHVSSPT